MNNKEKENKNKINSVNKTTNKTNKNNMANINIGIMDKNGKYPNPFTNKDYSNTWKKSPKWWHSLPMFADGKKIIKLIHDNQVLLVVSGTGSGKSVLVPFYALHSTNYKGHVVITIPKTSVVLKLSQGLASMADVELGAEIGFQYRGSKLSDGRPSKSDKTRILASTDGSIVAQLINDPTLKAYDVVIVDEAHERGIQIDILLLLLKKALKINPTLKLIIMSATVNPLIFENYFKKDFRYAAINVSGALTNHPVKIEYLSKELVSAEREFIGAGVKRIVQLLEETNPESGDILFFVNANSDAVNACQKLQMEVKNRGLTTPFCIEVSGGTEAAQLRYATDEFLFKNHPNGPFSRKVVIATNAVESSITINGLVYVIDSGWAYVDSYMPLRMEHRLLQERISKAQAIQRTGRVGRTKAGFCYRLYTEAEFKAFIDYPVVAIRKSDITDDILRFLSLPYVENIADLLKLLEELIEPPSGDFIKAAIYKLYALGAIDKMDASGKLTDLGEKMVRMKKVDPVMAKCMIKSFETGMEYEISIITALLTVADGQMNSIIADLRMREDDRRYKDEKAKFDRAKKKFASSSGDIITLLKIYKEYDDYSRAQSMEQTGQDVMSKWCRENYVKSKSLKRIRKMHQDILRETRQILFPRSPQTSTQPSTSTAMTKDTEAYLYDDDYDDVDEDFIENSNPITSGIGGYNREIRIDEDKIMDVLIQGMFINLARMVGNGKYRNCFPFEKSACKISRDSELKITKAGPKYIIYGDLMNVKGAQKYNIVSKMSETALKKLDKSQLMFIKDCFGAQKQAAPNNRSRDRSSHKQQKYKKYKHSYKKSHKQSYSYKKRK